jgi:type II secretory pathway pseudopilin PulG
MKSRRKPASGRILLVILLLAVLGVGASIYSAQTRKSARLQEEQRIAAQEKDRAQAERQELQRRQAQEKSQNDALKSSLKTVDDLVSRWDDAVKVASTSSRIALPGPVGILQATRREAEQLAVPPCLDEAKVQLVKSMNNTIEGFLVFMRNELKIGDTLAQINFEESGKQMNLFKEGRSACPL